MKKFKLHFLWLLLAALLLVGGCSLPEDLITILDQVSEVDLEEGPALSYKDIPEYDGQPFIKLNGDKPYFDESEITRRSYEKYGRLDSLGRCTRAKACLSTDTMPKAGEKRGEIGMVRPSGWVMKKYDCVNGEFCVNRAHLIGWALSAENANEKNLVTGTRYMNLEMEHLEARVREYLRDTGNHVMYRVTPVFVQKELMCRGLVMEVYSVEDQGEGLCTCRFYYNVQPGLAFDYKTGDSEYTGIFLDTESVAVNYDGIDNTETASRKGERIATYILNTNSKKFHKTDCPGLNKIKKKNRKKYRGSRKELIKEGYEPCGTCQP